QHKTCPQQSSLHRCGRYSESIGGFFDTQLFHVAQNKNLTIDLTNRRECLCQFFANFLSFESFRRDFAPVSELPRSVGFLLPLVLFDWLDEIGALFSSSH